jgi:hypothetical protein
VRSGGEDDLGMCLTATRHPVSRWMPSLTVPKLPVKRNRKPAGRSQKDQRRIETNQVHE